MTTSPPSDSESRSPESAFTLLHPSVQRWIWDRGWQELRDVQARAIPILLAGDRDVVIAASTAAGKTEAAFFPIVSRIAEEKPGSVHAMYVSPLKALINDQFGRLGAICEQLEIPVHRWHGDVSSSRKRKLLEKPKGILLITPESLEALFVNHGYRLTQLFPDLRYVVLDELHAFIGSERGRQLQSQLHRLEHLLRRSVPRVGLSATLGDMRLACDALRPGAGHDVELVESVGGDQELMLQVRGYVNRPPRRDVSKGGIDDADEHDGPTTGFSDVVEHLFANLRGADNLVFSNARVTVEALADRLRALSDRERVPNEFLAHHGSLSKELREHVEQRLKRKEAPFTAVCTSTLELGIDIGEVKSVAQVGPPHSVAALRQRLGRSGRRAGTPSILRMYVIEPEIDPRSNPVDALHIPLVQSIAMVRLLVTGWCEPPESEALHISTLVQQTMSLIAQFGGISAKRAFETLCESGPFRGLSPRNFAQLLRSLASNEIVRQESDGTLLLDLKGERIVNHYSFYAAFQSVDEFRVLHGSSLIGMIRLDTSLVPGVHLILGGRRWKVLSADPDERSVQVAPTGGGRLPPFEGSGQGRLHDRIRQEMTKVWNGADQPPFLDKQASSLLSDARAQFVRLGLDERRIVSVGPDSLFYVGRGDRIATVLELQLTAKGWAVTRRGPVLIVEKCGPDALRSHLLDLHEAGPASAESLAAALPSLRFDKFDWCVHDELLAQDHSARMFDTAGAHDVVIETLRG